MMSTIPNSLKFLQNGISFEKMSPLPTLLLLFILVIVITDGTIREKKLFLFSVIQFPHDPCVIRSDNSMNGICMSASHCNEKGGVQVTFPKNTFGKIVA